ncbi:hypothetical protein UMM65_03260 [Aureibaculum sp. 2210JD6-5]|uniref:hypothetical protein n=1 Tax=Aureibaculum sp. 2210JD6-5 TaxID=3103957 RepID=UPI002AAE04BF|nr:hypothetical protein [Aureibaculum sp. 2210JD6-5]MDY7394245.1 hypothetical protein [Aureibaculum sp. 2210JD6-5]
MVTVLKQGATKQSIRKILEKLAKEIRPKGVDVYKYCGKIKLDKDALTIQRGLRNEWE